jgi:hypothetical protein
MKFCNLYVDEMDSERNVNTNSTTSHKISEDLKRVRVEAIHAVGSIYVCMISSNIVG